MDSKNFFSFSRTPFTLFMTAFGATPSLLAISLMESPSSRRLTRSFCISARSSSASCSSPLHSSNTRMLSGVSPFKYITRESGRCVVLLPGSLSLFLHYNFYPHDILTAHQFTKKLRISICGSLTIPLLLLRPIIFCLISLFQG